MIKMQTFRGKSMRQRSSNPFTTSKKSWFLTVGFMVLFNCGYTQLNKSKLDRFFNQLSRKNKAMGSLVIAKNGKLLYNKTIGYGSINGADKKPLTSSSKFRIGSVTKMFTATMILQLVEEKKLRLEDTLSKFFPQIPNARKITVAQILAHRSGIHDIIEDKNLRPVKNQAVTEAQLLDIISRGAPDFDPGTKFAYSNSGYMLLGMIIEKLKGTSYGEALKKRITSKTGLKNTYVATGNINELKNESFSFRLVSDWTREEETNPGILVGAGSIISTPEDLALFIQALFNGKLISASSLRLMKPVQDEYGFGMASFDFAGKTFYGHTGGVDGFGTWLAYLPEEKLAVVYSANGKVYPVGKIVSAVVDIYYNQPFEIPSFASLAVSSDILDRYVGVYSTAGAPMKFTITRIDGSLYAQPNGQSAFPLEPVAENEFKIESAGMVFLFDADKKQMILKRNGRERVFIKETD